MRLFKYHHWSIIIMLNYTEDQGEELFDQPVMSVFSSIRECFEHLYWADQTWFNRMRGIEQKVESSLKNAQYAKAKFHQIHESIKLF